jgi:hypothetical protein
MKFRFKFFESTILIDIESIKSSKGHFTSTDLIIHDSFCKHDDNIYYLVTFLNDNIKIYWLTKKQLRPSDIVKYSEKMASERNDNTEFSCKLNKVR